MLPLLLTSFLLPVLFLAQALPHHGKAAATPAPSPEVRITIVNAMSVPAITLSTYAGGKDSHAMTYPSFPQGTWTSDQPLKSTNIDFAARTTNGTSIADRKLIFPPVSSQMLLITGDLTTTGPAETLPAIARSPLISVKPWLPNLQFHSYSCSKATNDLCRYRVVNAMPSKLLILRAPAEGNKPAQQLALLTPGNSALFIKQSPNLHWDAEIDGKVYPLDMEQEEEKKNCLIPFFLRGGQPTFIRVFENQ